MDVIVAMIVLLLLTFVTLPSWPYSRTWTFYPAGVCGLLVTILALLAATGRV